jgi:hypothetical protein
MNKKLLGFILGCLIPSTTFGAAVIFSGNDVKALKSNLDLNGQAKILSGTVDPTATATSANAGSLYLNTSNAKQYRKQDNGSSTNWVEVGSAGSSGGINFLVNGDFEAGAANWTATGLAFSIGTGAAALIDLKSGVANASATGQKLTSAGVAIASSSFKGLKGGQGWFSCFASTTATDYTLQVTDGTNVLATRLIAPTTAATEQGQYFPIPTSGSIYLELLSASNAADISLDNCFMGSKQIAQVGQASIVGGGVVSQYYQTTSTSSVAATSGTGAATTAFGACVPGAANTAEIVCTLPPGKYEVDLLGGNVQSSGGSTGYGASVSFGDGVTLSPGVFLFSNTDVGQKNTGFASKMQFTLTTAAVKTFNVYLYAVGGGTATYSADGATYVVKRFPLENEGAARFDTIAWSYSAQLTGSAWSTTSGSYTVPTAGGASSLTPYPSSNIVCTQNGNDPALNCTIPVVGKVHACVDSNALIGTSGQIVYIGLYGDSVLLGEKAIGTTEQAPFTVCGDFTPAATTFPIAIAMKTSGGATGSLNAGSPNLTFTLSPLDQQIPAPLIVGGVVSSSQGVTKIVSGRFGDTSTTQCATNPCGYVDAAGVTSVSRSGLGNYQINLAAGTFTSVPFCTFTATKPGSYQLIGSGSVSPNTTTEIYMTAYKLDGTGNTDDALTDFICVGAK